MEVLCRVVAAAVSGVSQSHQDTTLVEAWSKLPREAKGTRRHPNCCSLFRENKKMRHGRVEKYKRLKRVFSLSVKAMV